MYVCMYVCNSYNTGKSALPDIYARRPRASAYISSLVMYRHPTDHVMRTNASAVPR